MNKICDFCNQKITDEDKQVTIPSDISDECDCFYHQDCHEELELNFPTTISIGDENDCY